MAADIALEDAVKYFQTEWDETILASERRELLKNVGMILEVTKREEITTKLLPRLRDLAFSRYAEDESLHMLAGELKRFGNFLDVSSEEECRDVYAILEHLCGHDEIAVRDAAIDTLGHFLSVVCPSAKRANLAMTTYIPIFRRLVASDHLMKRAAAAHLYTQVYPFIDADCKSSSTGSLTDLRKDEWPVVQRATAQSMVLLTEHASGEEILNFFYRPLVEFWSDKADEQTKAWVVHGFANMAGKIDEQKFKSLAVPFLQRALVDYSWRVRLSLLDKLEQLCANAGERPAIEMYTSWLCKLMNDYQLEVVSTAVGVLEKCIRRIPPDLVSSSILPVLMHLTESQNAIGREDETLRCIASLLSPLAERLGPAKTKDDVLPLLVALSSNSSREVRCTAVEQIVGVCSNIHSQEAMNDALEIINGAIGDIQWRVRLVLIKQFAQLIQLYKSNFESPWDSIFFNALLDQTDAVRVEVINSIPGLVECLGLQWCLDYLLKHLLALYDLSNTISDVGGSGNHANCGNSAPYKEAIQRSKRKMQAYTIKKTLLLAFKVVAAVLPGKKVMEEILPRIHRALVSDPITNIKILCITHLEDLAIQNGSLPQDWIREVLKPVLQDLSSSAGSDPDVRWFAQRSLARYSTGVCSTGEVDRC